MIAYSKVRPVHLPIVIGLIIIAGCSKPAIVESPQDQVKSTLEIIELPKGTIAARPDSSEAAFARYLASNEPTPRTFRFNAGEFAPWSDTLSMQTRETLANIVIILKNYPQAKLRIAGYTDDEGTAAANQALSQERVDTLQKLLSARGIDQSRIESVGLGPVDPIANNDTPAGRAENRRIEIIVTAE